MSGKKLLGVVAALLVPGLIPLLLNILSPLVGMSPTIYYMMFYLGLPFLLVVLAAATRPCSLNWMAAGFFLSLAAFVLLMPGGTKTWLSIMSLYAIPWGGFSLLMERTLAKREKSQQ